MCGFFFEFSNNLTKKNSSQISQFKNELYKRGPDNFKYINEKKFFVAFSRLSIQDLNNRSNQPFTDKKKRYLLIFNGELYNFLELKKNLENEGIKFNTKSDTEVLFNLIIYKGIKYTLNVIRGMFSFIFLDKKKNIFYGARDHFGQKPFYYSKSKTNFLASTNIKPILDNLKSSSKELDLDSVNKYFLSSGIISVSKTFFKNISTLPAGSYFKFHNNKFKINKYFNLYNCIKKNKILMYRKKNQDELLKILDTKLNNAIKRHLLSDAKIGVTCSGGIDSSLILFYLSKIKNNFKVFSNKTPDIEKLSSIVPKIIELNNISKKKSYFIKQYKKDYFKDLYKLTKSNLFPARWGGGPPMKKLCGFAKSKKIKVLLGGDGVDEYFCGYQSFKKTLNKKNKSHNLHEILTLKGNSKMHKNYYEKIINSKKKITKKISFVKDKKEKKVIINSLLDIEFFLQSCTLPHADEYSMSESIELRSPFLDLDLVEFCLNLPLKYKINKENKFINKYLFRKLAKKHYGKFIDRKKEGTRNFSKFISNKKFWNFQNFKILKRIKVDKDLSYKEIFKLINLEILLRTTTQDLKNIDTIFSKRGANELL